MTNKSGPSRKAHTPPGQPPTHPARRPSFVPLTTDQGSTTVSNPSNRGSVSPTSSKPKPVLHYHGGKPDEPRRSETMKHPKHYP